MITSQQINKCVEVAKRYGATKLVLFGSAAEDPEHARDIDLVVNGVDGWEFYGLVSDLNEAAGAPVDAVPFKDGDRFISMAIAFGRLLYAA